MRSLFLSLSLSYTQIVEYASPWLSSIYWAVTTMSTIGYGDISPGTVPERLLGKNKTKILNPFLFFVSHATRVCVE